MHRGRWVTSQHKTTDTAPNQRPSQSAEEDEVRRSISTEILNKIRKNSINIRDVEERFVTSRAEREWRDDRTRIGKTIQIPPRRTRPLHRYVTHLTSATLLRGNTTRKRHRRATAQCWRHACKNHSIRKWPWNIMRCLLLKENLLNKPMCCK